MSPRPDVSLRSDNLRPALGSLLLAFSLWLPAWSAARAERLPNFVVIFIDDMGHADIGPFGAKAYSTPHLDRMAREGRIFTDFYAATAVCTASRASLMTGCYNVRIGLFGALTHRANHGIGAGEMTFAEVVKQKGYATACYGKWHLGHHPKFLPTSHGFDEYLGLPYSNDMWPLHPTAGKDFPDLPLLEATREGTRIADAQVTDEDQNQLTTLYTERTVRFIERNADRPFLVYLPHSMVHVPLHVSDRFRGKSERGLFGDVVMEVDWSVGQILDALRRLGLDKDTLVIFTADNGPWLSYGDHAGSAGVLREGKGTMFDGGCREPTVMWWPGKIPAGTVCRTPAMTIDILPTLARLVGARLPDHPIDGKDIWPLMSGAPEARNPHEAYYFYWGEHLQAVRMGKWKLHFPHAYPTLAGRPGGTGGKPAPYVEGKIERALFDLESDPGETTDVAARHPDVVARMEEFAGQMRAELGDSATGQKGSGVREPGRLEARDARFDWRPGEPIRDRATPDSSMPSEGVPVFVGTYTGGKSEGIYLLRLDPTTGRLSGPSLAAKTPSPSFLAFHASGRFLYASNETGEFRGEKTGSVSAFGVEAGTGKLAFLNDAASGGTFPCHLAADPTGRNLLVANYGSGTVSVLRIAPDGRLAETTAVVQHRGSGPNSRRQEGPHAHAVVVDSGRAFVADLGTDEVVVYRFSPESGALEREDALRIDPGSGPRHLAFAPGGRGPLDDRQAPGGTRPPGGTQHSDGRRLWVINELVSTVTCFARSDPAGPFEKLQTISTLPEGFRGESTTAEIQVSPDGRFVYGSNRGHDSIAAFRVDPEKGTLSPIEHEPTRGKTPRNFRIDPSGRLLLAANQGSDSVVVFRINAATGALEPTGHEARVPTPVCVEFAPGK